MVALNPGTDTPFRPYWDGRTFDKQAWLADYRQRHGGVLKTTRRYLERLISGLHDVHYLETNLYPFPSRRYTELLIEHANSDVFDFLVNAIRPRVMFVVGADTIAHVCSRADIPQIPKDERFTCLTWSGVAMEVMADNHFSHPGSWSNAKVDRIAAALRTRCQVMRQAATHSR